MKKILVMRELLKELEERLESLPKSTLTDGRIAEVCLCIIKVQEMILDGLKGELREGKINEVLK